MKNLNFYIAYLLTKHECVIIPGLGAFIASAGDTDAVKKAGLLCPPTQTVGFNPEIKHNDGLLSSAVAKGEKISYKEACLQITRQVELLNMQLIQQKSISIPWIGQLILSHEQKIIFIPSIHLSCNALYYGLNNFYLPVLEELEETVEARPVSEKEERVYDSIRRNLLRYVSVAAAVLALFFISMPLNEPSSSNIQQAGFIRTPIPPVETPVKEVQPDTTIVMEQPAKNTVTVERKDEKPRYYIVIASLPNRILAEQQVENFHRQGFTTAAVISKEDKHRVYIHKFAHKPEAEDFLRDFRDQYPEHASAWLLSQR